MREQRITNLIFFVAFAAFLGSSISHVAWLYHFYEENNDSLLGWIISYAIAVSIDVLILWLSYVASKGTLADIGVIVVFTFGLVLLSWYANWIYDMAHNPSYHGNVWSMSPLDLFTSFATVGDLTPKIISAIPVFIMAYTYMQRRISHSVLDVKDYSDYADKLQQVNEQKQRIATLKRAARNETIGNAISDVVGIGKKLRTSITTSDTIVTPEAPLDTTIVTPEAPSDTTIISAPSPLLLEMAKEQHTNNTIQTPEASSDVTIVPAPSEDRHTDRLTPVVASNGHATMPDDFNDFINMIKQ